MVGGELLFRRLIDDVQVLLVCHGGWNEQGGMACGSRLSSAPGLVRPRVTHCCALLGRQGSSFFNKLSVCFNGIDRINDGTFDRNKNKNKAEMPAFRNNLVQTERIGHIKSLY